MGTASEDEEDLKDALESGERNRDDPERQSTRNTEAPRLS